MKKFSLLFLILLMFNAFGKQWDAVYINKLVAKGEIDKVIDFYKTRYYGENRIPQDAFKIAELYVKKKQYADAIQWYDKESQLINTSKVNLLNYANANRLMGEYQKALDGYLMYAALTGDVNKVMDLANQCEKILKSAALAYNYKLDNYSYNTANDETNLGVLRTNPIYISIDNSNQKNHQPTYTAYQIVRQFENFSAPVKSYNNNVPKLIITNISFSKDGNTAVFSAIDEKTKSKNNKTPNEKIYTADYLGGDFFNVHPFPFNVDGYSQKNPTFNSDATAIYFASNISGGFGGFDIWKSVKKNNNWTAPINLGKLLNTASNEINPFLVQDGKDNTLYFSSDREGGYGGYDIYRASFSDSIWQDVQLQTAPINSAGDDISIIYDATINTGYFSSDRNGGKGGFDIYRFIPFNLKLNVTTKDTFSEKIIDYALVQVFENNEKLLEGVTNENGEATFQIRKDRTYTLKISKDGFRPISIKINSNGKGSGDSVMAEALLKPDAQFSISKGATNNLSLENYIFFTGKVIDAATNKPAYTAKMRMVNYTTQKLREVDIDSTGRFEIKLLLNNNYKIIFDSQDNRITDELSTYGLEKNNIKVRDYLLSGTKFKLLENRVYDANTLPPNIPIQMGNIINKVATSNNYVTTNEPITQNKIDSLLKVVSKDNSSKQKSIIAKTATKPNVNITVAATDTSTVNKLPTIINTKPITEPIATNISTIDTIARTVNNAVDENPILQKDTNAITTDTNAIITNNLVPKDSLPKTSPTIDQESALAADMVSTKNIKKEKKKNKESNKTESLSLKTLSPNDSISKDAPTPTVVNEKNSTPSEYSTKLPDSTSAIQIEETAAPETVVNNMDQKPRDTTPLYSTAETLPDNYYKIQIASYEVNNIKFPELENIGKIEEVKAYERYIYRIGNFENLEKAKEVLDLVRSKGYFVAFILQYNKEKIIGIVN